MVIYDEINVQGSSISTISDMFCTGATFVKKNSCLVTRIVSFDNVGLHPLTFCILEPYPSKDILALMTTIIIVPFLV